jgi:DNA replication protein DnaC
MAKKIKETITRQKYLWYKQMDNLEDHEKKEIEQYEKENPVKISKPSKEYWNKVFADNKPKEFQVSYDVLLTAFLRQFYQNEGVKFNKNKLEEVSTILYYFSRDNRFFEAKNIFTELSNSPSSFEKGLMIIGGYGTGKSSTMNALCDLLRGTPIVFKSSSAKKIIEQYEYTDKDNKKQFLENLETGTMYFDDIKTERTANNYGVKVNLFDHILFERDRLRSKTYITCNYKKDRPGDIKATLLEFNNIYSPQVYDRLFKMFNIIEFTGKSLR